MVILALIIAANVLMTEKHEERPSLSALREGPIQVEVINGTGEHRLAQRCTDYLRLRGFDVVDYGTSGVGVDQSLVIDRGGGMDKALEIASALGLNDTSIVTRADKNLYLDVSVILGTDYALLKPFRTP